jgi:hypothetical protein
MKIEVAALRTQSGVTSPILIGFAGFAAGALLMGLLAFHPAPKADEPLRIPASSAPQDAVRLENVTLYAPDRLTAAGPWSFESATSTRAPGKTRPDRLSAPEGWTYDATGRTE